MSVDVHVHTCLYSPFALPWPTQVDNEKGQAQGVLFRSLLLIVLAQMVSGIIIVVNIESTETIIDNDVTFN